MPLMTSSVTSCSSRTPTRRSRSPRGPPSRKRARTPALLRIPKPRARSPPPVGMTQEAGAQAPGRRPHHLGGDHNSRRSVIDPAQIEARSSLAFTLAIGSHLIPADHGPRSRADGAGTRSRTTRVVTPRPSLSANPGNGMLSRVARRCVSTERAELRANLVGPLLIGSCRLSWGSGDAGWVSRLAGSGSAARRVSW